MKDYITQEVLQRHVDTGKRETTGIITELEVNSCAATRKKINKAVAGILGYDIDNSDKFAR